MDIFISYEELYNISKGWLSFRKEGKKEVFFLARPFNFDNPDSRILIASNKDNNVIGFVIFTPIFENNRIIAYVPDMIRTISEAARGTGDYIIYKAIDKFKAEGLKFMPLGLSPLYKINIDSLNLSSSKILINMLKLIYKYGNINWNNCWCCYNIRNSIFLK